MTAASLRAPVKVELQDATGGPGLPEEGEWARWIGETLVFVADRDEDEAHSNGSVTVRLVGDEESQHLNSTYRNKTGATNVLAFSGTQNAMIVPDEDRELGDIVICVPVVCREARDQGKQTVAHMAHMAVHGTLHLLGFDHEDEKAARRMEGLETQILDRLGFSDPYTSPLTTE